MFNVERSNCVISCEPKYIRFGIENWWLCAGWRWTLAIKEKLAHFFLSSPSWSADRSFSLSCEKKKNLTDQFRRIEIFGWDFFSSFYLSYLHSFIGSWWFIICWKKKCVSVAMALEGACARYDDTQRISKKERKKKNKTAIFFSLILSIHRLLCVPS